MAPAVPVVLRAPCSVDNNKAVMTLGDGWAMAFTPSRSAVAGGEGGYAGVTESDKAYSAAVEMITALVEQGDSAEEN